MGSFPRDMTEEEYNARMYGAPPPRFLCDSGETRSRDPQRFVWYSAYCGYWTDNWNTLATVGSGIPCCPHCFCPGMQTTYEAWMAGATRFEQGVGTSIQRPRYVEWVNTRKEVCGGRGFDFLNGHKVWLKQQAKMLVPGAAPALSEVERLRKIVAAWRSHIERRYKAHTEELARGEIPLEVLHTCHGCGNGPFHLNGGLCPSCCESLLPKS